MIFYVENTMGIAMDCNSHIYAYFQVKGAYLPSVCHLPIAQGRAPHYHWYLAVINTKKRCIQVLDSLGKRIPRKDLTAMVSK
jgi:hypothetical protein